MVQINFAMKEVNCKVVYYGPGMSGKTTNLEVVHKKAPEQHRGELTSISTDGDRTLFFDFMPLDLGTIAGMRTKFQLYTVPGQVYYNSTRKLVLQGVDGVVFVADSDPAKLQENLESLANLEENLREYGKDLSKLAHVFQWNKRDMPGAMTVADLNAQMNKHGAPHYEAIAKTGEGVFPTLKALAASVLEGLNKREGSPMPTSRLGAPAPAAPLPSAAPAQATPSGFVAGASFPPSAAPAGRPGAPGARPAMAPAAAAVAAPPSARPHAPAARPHAAPAARPQAAPMARPQAAPGSRPSAAPVAPRPAAAPVGARPAVAPRPAAAPARRTAPVAAAAKPVAAVPVRAAPAIEAQGAPKSNKAVVAGVAIGALAALALLGVVFLFFFQ